MLNKIFEERRVPQKLRLAVYANIVLAVLALLQKELLTVSMAVLGFILLMRYIKPLENYRNNIYYSFLIGSWGILVISIVGLIGYFQVIQSTHAFYETYGHWMGWNGSFVRVGEIVLYVLQSFAEIATSALMIRALYDKEVKTWMYEPFHLESSSDTPTPSA